MDLTISCFLFIALLSLNTATLAPSSPFNLNLRRRRTPPTYACVSDCLFPSKKEAGAAGQQSGQDNGRIIGEIIRAIIAGPTSEDDELVSVCNIYNLNNVKLLCDGLTKCVPCVKACPPSARYGTAAQVQQRKDATCELAQKLTRMEQKDIDCANNFCVDIMHKCFETCDSDLQKVDEQYDKLGAGGSDSDIDAWSKLMCKGVSCLSDCAIKEIKDNCDRESALALELERSTSQAMCGAGQKSGIERKTNTKVISGMILLILGVLMK